MKKVIQMNIQEFLLEKRLIKNLKISIFKHYFDKFQTCKCLSQILHKGSNLLVLLVREMIIQILHELRN